MCYGSNPNHHLGRSFLTAYQLAIEYHRQFGDLPGEPCLPIGGSGTGAHRSMAQQLARELSQRIRSGDIQDIEGGFLSSRNLSNIAFIGVGEIIRPSVKDISIFRLTADEADT